MLEVKTEIEIHATVDKVWNILTDINNWSEWSPIIIQASGNTTLGSTLSITMRGKEGKDGPKYSPIITELTKPTYFRWQAKMVANFIFTNDKIFELEEIETGTRLVHKELFDGIFAPLFCRNIEDGVLPMLNSMNEALKELVEKGEDISPEENTLAAGDEVES